MNNEAYAFNFDFDEELLLNEWNTKYSNEAKAYTDPRYEKWKDDPEMRKKYGDWDWNSWKIAKTEYNDYTRYLCNFFDVNADPRFYILKANTTLPMHVDFGTECAINFLLGSDLAPVSYASGNEYYYKTGLLNTSIEHSVTNGNSDRIIFKLSIKDEPFESVLEKIKSKTS